MTDEVCNVTHANSVDLKWAPTFGFKFLSFIALAMILVSCASPIGYGGSGALAKNLAEAAVEATDTPLHASPAHANPYTAHTADLFRSMRTRRDPVSPVEEGHAASTLGNVADIALRLGRKLRWDPQADRFVNDAEVDSMRSRAARSPWSI